MSNNLIVNIGDLIFATDAYHNLYRDYRWYNYCDFIIAEVVSVGSGVFTVEAIDRRHPHRMPFALDWVSPISSPARFLKVYAK